MFSPLTSLLMPLLLAWGSGPTKPAAVRVGQTQAQPGQQALSEPDKLSAADPTWARMLARDNRISFTPRSAHDARLRLAAGETGNTERIESLMAIGCSVPQAVRERPLLEHWSQNGSDQDRGAALLALGEFGEGADAALLRGLEDPAELVRGCALLGLLRSGRPTSRIRVEAVAAGASGDAQIARDLLVTVFDPGASSESEVARFWLDLRWGAARRFGLVDGDSWKARLIANLLDTPEFLDSLVLMSAAEKPHLGTRDHLMSHLLVNRSATDIRAAALAMPGELARLIESGLWAPQDARTWQIILDEIDQTHGEERALALLLQGMMVPSASMSSLRLVVRSGLRDVLVDLELGWPSMSSREKQLACQSWAMGGDEVPLGALLEFQDDENPQVRAQLRVALARLGNAESHLELRMILEDPAHGDYASTLRASLTQADGPLVRGYLETLLDVVEGDTKIDVAVALALNGNAQARLVLAKLLVDGFPPGKRGVRCIRALTMRDPSASLDLVLRAFPVEGDLPLNIGLARALVRAQHSSVIALLRAALWTGPFDRSILAADVIISVGGLHTLRDELNRPPLDASSADMRRLGFALGEWGGMRELKRLKQMIGSRSANPVLQGALLGALGQRTH